MSIERARPIAAWAISCCIALAVSGCASDVSEAGAEIAAIAEDEQRSSAVYVVETGHWSDYVQRGGWAIESFWVDLSVRNDAFSKDVGIVWTTDGWATVQRTSAVYEGTLPDGRERWGVDVARFGSRSEGNEPEVELAAFVTMNGETHWSPFRNHFVYRGVTPSRPVRLLSSRVTWDGSVTSLEGTVRSLRSVRPRRVLVRYTLDGWATWDEAEAAPEDGEHTFAIPLAIEPSSTEEVAFAIRLELDGQSVWDNADGQDYHHRLAPIVDTAVAGWSGRAVDGLVAFEGRAETALPVRAVRVRVDGGEWESLPLDESFTSSAAGFSPGGGFRRVLETRGLAAGPHSVEVEVSAGPLVRVAEALVIDVAGAIASTGTVVLPQSDRGTAWDVDRGPDGRLVVAYERGLVRLDEQGAIDLEYEAYQGRGSFRDVEVTTQYAYALAAPRIARYEAATGALDRTFGVDGVLEINEAVTGGTPLCWLSDIAADDETLIVTDSCNARVLRFTPDGVFVDALPLGGGVSSAFVHLPVLAADGLWVWRRSDGESGLVGELVAIDVRPDAPLAVLGEIRAEGPIVQGATALAVGGDVFWVVTGDGHLTQYGRDGTRRATWLGGGLHARVVPGVISNGRHIEVFADGSVEVLSAQTRALERFAPVR